MTLNYTITEEQYINFRIFHSKHFRPKKGYYIVGGIVFILAIFVVPSLFNLLMRFISEQTGSVITSFGFIDAKIVTVVFLFLYLYWLIFFLPKNLDNYIVKKCKKMFKKDTGGYLTGDKTLKCEDETLAYINNNRIAKPSYKSLAQAFEANDCFYIYTAERSALVLPLSAFESQEQKHEFERFINNKKGTELFKLQESLF